MIQEHNSEHFLFVPPTDNEEHGVFSELTEPLFVFTPSAEEPDQNEVEDEEYNVFSETTESLFVKTPSAEELEQEVKQLAENEQIEIKAS